MGLFFNSESDRNREDIVNEIMTINLKLKKMESITIDGICDSNVDHLNTLIDEVSSSLEIAKRKMAGLSNSQMNKLVLPWVDGSYIPVYIWDLSFRKATSIISDAIDQYVDNINK